MAPNVWQSATPDPGSEYLEIDLGSVQFVYGIRLLGRTDCDPGNPDCPNRMRNVRIEMSLTPSADGASFLETQTAAIISSGAIASAANFQGASTALFQGASGTAFQGASAAQGLRDSGASFQEASTANFLSASTANFEAKQQASGTTFLGASAAQNVADSRAQFLGDSRAQGLADSGSSYIKNSGASVSGAQAFESFGNDPKNGRIVTSASPPDSAIQDQTIILSALGIRSGYKTRYIILRAPSYTGDGILNLSQVIVYDSSFGSSRKNNIAYGK
jgi:hypothetical protein